MVILYVIEGEQTRKRYVGITSDLQRRLSEHRSGSSHSGNLIGPPFTLIHTEIFQDYTAARQREKFLKSGQGREWLAQRIARS